MRHARSRFFASGVSRLMLLALLSATWAAPATLVLPPGESPAEWRAALAAAELRVGTQGVHVLVDGARWRVRYTGPEGVREALVPVPRSEADREAVAIVAASLLRSGPVLPPVAPTRVTAEPSALLPPAPTATPRATPVSARADGAPPARTPPGTSRPAPVAVEPPVTPPPAEPRTIEPTPAPTTDSLAAAPEIPEPPPPPVPVVEPPAAPPPPVTPRAAPRAARAIERSAAPTVDGRVSVSATWRPSLSVRAGVGSDLRVRVGPAWVAAVGAWVSETDLGTGGLALAELGGAAGLRQTLTPVWGLREGVGATAQVWAVEDLDGARLAFGTAVAATIGVERRIGNATWLDLSVCGAWDLQRIRLDTQDPDPSRASLAFSGGVRLGE